MPKNPNPAAVATANGEDFKIITGSDAGMDSTTAKDFQSSAVPLVASNAIALPITDKPLTGRSAAELVTKLNEQYAVVQHGGKVVILTFERHVLKVGRAEYVRMVATFIRFSDFKNLLMHRRVKIGKTYVSIGEWWLQQPDRRQYDGLVYAPGNTAPVIDNKFNLWRGWGIEPKQGEWSLMKAHIRTVMAGGNRDRFAYIINWLAWCIQNPDQQAEVVLIFRGRKGTGKGVLGSAMTRIFGQHGYHISSAGQLVGKHNAHLRDCSFLFCDEAFWPGDLSAEGNLKRMVTESTLDIEAKYFNSILVPNMLHILMTSNDSWIVPAGEFERRYVLNEVSDIHLQDAAWFVPLFKQLDEGGYGAMLFDLLHHDLKDFHPRQLPPDTGLTDQQQHSLQPLDAWICELLENGTLSGCDSIHYDRAVSNGYETETDGGAKIKTPGLYDQAKSSVPKLRSYTADHLLGAHLRKLGCTKCKISGRRGWQFPPLDTLRRDWEKRFGKWNWADPEITSWQAEIHYSKTIAELEANLKAAEKALEDAQAAPVQTSRTPKF